MDVQVKRVYEEASADDGLRVLIDRLWPRGVSKEAAAIDWWAKELTPSDELRRWFHANTTERFETFCTRYAAELAALPASAVEGFVGATQVTLVTAVKDIEHSHVPTLLRYLEQRL